MCPEAHLAGGTIIHSAVPESYINQAGALWELTIGPTMTDLYSLGFTPEIAASLQALDGLNTIPARIINQQRRNYLANTADGVLSVTLPSGLAKRLLTEGGTGALPVVGDWVAVVKGTGSETCRIEAVLPRRNKLSRKVAGQESREQVIAANIDRILIVTAVGDEFNPRRLERYLAIAHETGVYIAIVLNKLDDIDTEQEGLEASEKGVGSHLEAGKEHLGPEPYLEAIRSIAPNIQTLALSAMTGAGVERVRDLFQPGETAVLIGSSGVGKSTLINTLLGYERQPILEVRAEDAHGRHATTSRELIVLPGGSMVIDNPGLREIQLWIEGDGLARTFRDVEELACSCRFKDCTHQSEPGCAVKQAVSTGELDGRRLENYLKLQRELEMSDTRFRAIERKRKGRMIATYRKQVQERRRRGEKG